MTVETETGGIPEALCVIMELAELLGVRDIKELPGCWEHRIDKHWAFAVNGHKTPMSCALAASEIPPYSTYVDYNGWPAAIFNAAGGQFVAGTGANEHTFIAAMRAEIAIIMGLKT